MKKTLIYLTLATGLLTAGCQNSSPVTAGSTAGNYPTNVAKMVYPLKEAKSCIQLFNSLCKDTLKLDTVPISAYTIRAVDLLASMGASDTLIDSLVNTNKLPYKFARVYLGYRKSDESFRLFIVPVEGADMQDPDKKNWKGGKDIFLNKNGNPIPPGPGKKNEGDEYVLDLNAPCPTTCATESPLQ